MKRFLILLALIGLLLSCRSSRTIGKAVARKDSTTRAASVPTIVTPKNDSLQLIKAVLSQIADNRIPFTAFSAKVSVDFKGTDGKKNSANANIKMYRDSVLWVSVYGPLGIEGVRVLITKDSVKLINKLEKTYSLRSIGFLQEVTRLPLNLHTLQELIIGNPVYLDTNVVQYTRRSGIINLISIGQYFKNTATFNATDTTILHSVLTDVDPVRNRTADLTYANYEDRSETPFATKRQIVVSEQGRLEIKLDFKNYSFAPDDLSFPFRIPKNYKKE